MKLNLNESDLKRLKRVIENKDINMYISDFVLDYVLNYSSPIDDNNLNDLINEGYSFEDAVKRLIGEDMRLNELGKFEKKIINEQVISHIKKLNYEEYINDPYYQNIKIDNVKFEDWNLTINKYKPYEAFISNDLKYGEDYKEILSLSYFDKEYPYITVIQNNVIWMTITPSERDTMIEDIKNATGDVITFGLGLGYFAYMVSLKDEVTSVTIVEKDKKVIDLFNKHILPQFKYKDKIRIISSDAYEMLNNEQIMKEYSYVYIDIWHGAEDGVFHYLKMKNIEKKNNQKFYYWLETSILAYLRRTVITLFQENLEGYTDKNYVSVSNDFDKLINSLYFKTRYLEINSFSDIEQLLSDDRLKCLILDN